MDTSLLKASCSMENLSSDILREIMDFLDPSWDDYSIATHWIRMPKHYKHSENQRDISDFARLRLVCKRFSTLGASYLFRCVVQRFNRQSFRRLECLSEHPELGCHVRKFVYLMPYLYVKGRLAASRIFFLHPPFLFLSLPGRYLKETT